MVTTMTKDLTDKMSEFDNDLLKLTDKLDKMTEKMGKIEDVTNKVTDEIADSLLEIKGELDIEPKNGNT